jgi:hypothetical protein
MNIGSRLARLRKEGEPGCPNQRLLCPVDGGRNRPAHVPGVPVPSQLSRPSRRRRRRGSRGRKTRGEARFGVRCARAAGNLEMLRRCRGRRGFDQRVRVHEGWAVACRQSHAPLRRRMGRFDCERRGVCGTRSDRRRERARRGRRGADARSCRGRDVGDVEPVAGARGRDWGWPTGRRGTGISLAGPPGLRCRCGRRCRGRNRGRGDRGCGS